MGTGVPILAALLSPALFYAGAAAMAAPILIHLLARRRFRRIRWAAMDFLIHAERRNRRRLRMEEWILLALRCLALFLIGLMLARPLLDPAGLAGALGGDRRTERIFLLDDSYSMAYAGPDGTPFGRAKVAVRRVIDLVRRETPDDTVTLARMSDVEHPVDAGTYLDDRQTQELYARLEALAPIEGVVDPESAIAKLAEWLATAPGVTNAAVYILSDFQRYNWAPPARGPDAAGGRLFAPLIEWADENRTIRILFIDLSEDGAANTAVTGLHVESGQLIAGSDAIVRAVVGNFSERSLDGVRLQATVGNLLQPSESIDGVGALQTAAVDIRVAFFRPGYDPLRVELPPDALPIDNARYLAAEVVNAIRILVVNGQPSADAYDDEVTFLTTALRPEGQEFSGNELTVVDETQLADTNLEPFHLVILANVYRLDEPVIESLERFVRSGGGLLIFAGDQVDADLYNTALYKQGEGLLPGELTELVRPSEPVHLVLTDRLHPALRGLAREGDPLGIGQIPFFQFFGCVPHGGAGAADNIGLAEAGASLQEGAVVTRPARTLARFDDADEHPAIVERVYGRGRVMLVTTSADKDWNLWPDHPTFLPVVMELARSVARRSGEGNQHLVGEPVEMEIDAAQFDSDAVVRTPAFPNERETTITAQAGDGPGLALRWEHTQQSGIYQFVLRRRDGGESTRLVAVNVDTRESDLSAANEAELRRASGELPVTYVKGLEKIGGTGGEARTELWRVCLIAALITLMSEQTLAWWWGRRR